MTPDDLYRLEQLHHAATEGPWAPLLDKIARERRDYDDRATLAAATLPARTLTGAWPISGDAITRWRNQ